MILFSKYMSAFQLRDASTLIAETRDCYFDISNNSRVCIRIGSHKGNDAQVQRKVVYTRDVN